MNASEVERLAGLVDRLEREMAALRADLAKATSVIAERDARITELEKALEGSRRSGKRQAAPFSKGDPKPEPKTAGRKAGEGHGRHGHRMAPVGPPDRELHAPLPDRCPDCGGSVVHDRDDFQWQVDMPEPRVITTRFTVAVGHCTHCDRRVQGRHAEQTSDALGAAGSGIGPKAKAWAAWLHYGMGLSFRRCADVLAHLGLKVTAGAICSSSAASASTDLVRVHHDLVVRANASPAVTMDETGWRVGGNGAWLWVAATEGITMCWVADGRGFDEATTVIGAGYDGVLVRDGWVVYRNYKKAAHQSCTAHLLRRCAEMESDLAPTDRPTPAAAKAILLDGLAARDLPRAEKAKAATELTVRMAELCARPQANDANRRLLAHLAKESDALFTYLLIDGVDATNWRGETGVRPCVVNRKTWGGNRTWRGAKTQGVITSVIATAAKNGVDAIAYLAARARSPDPGLTILLG
ncbi:MAG: IS66 family transposase [Pseudonocardiaceae bacterium]